MAAFERVTEKWGNLKYMKEPRALFLKDLIVKENVSQIIEMGFFHGKSSAYFAAILEDMGGDGHLTTIDIGKAKTREPNIHEVLESVGLSHRVTPIFAHRSYTWELGRMITREPRPQFDLCYLDGGHTWDATGFGFLLVDMLLRPGGWIVFDDLDWTITESVGGEPLENFPHYQKYDKSERDAKGVRMVFESLVPHLGYINCREIPKFRWGVAQKAPSKVS